jgi:hypothetical protein
MNDQEEFKNFLKADELLPSRKIDLSILSQIQSKIDPPFTTIFFKLSIIQAFIGLLTMLFCPQFELSLTANQQSYHYFHITFGYYGCMAICGVIFLGSAALFASLILSRDEVRKINSYSYLFFPSLCILTLLIFFVLGAKLFVESMLFWSLGGTLGSILFFYLGAFFKNNLYSKIIS